MLHSAFAEIRTFMQQSAISSHSVEGGELNAMLPLLPFGPCDQYGQDAVKNFPAIRKKAQWHEVIGDPTYADAILDRLIHNAQRIELSGESLRKTKARPTKKD